MDWLLCSLGFSRVLLWFCKRVDCLEGASFAILISHALAFVRDQEEFPANFAGIGC